MKNYCKTENRKLVQQIENILVKVLFKTSQCKHSNFILKLFANVCAYICVEILTQTYSNVEFVYSVLTVIILVLVITHYRAVSTSNNLFQKIINESRELHELKQ